ncbi:MAG: transcriptional repressor [Deltaproteobacteria bacterium]|nr:transcriptional repressor [Deltaproteobacteria bacterium]
MMMEPAEINQMIETFPTRCRAAGLKVTPQRVAAFSMLAHSDAHPTAEDVYMAIRHQIPAVSLGTVYKILDTLHQRGFLRKVATQGQTARYDARLTPHQHGVCTECGTLVDLPAETMPAALWDIPKSAGFHAEACEVLFQGTCAHCADAKASRAS